MTLMLRRILIAAIIIMLLVVVRLFPDSNQTLVNIDLLAIQIEAIELWLVLMASFFGGATLTFLFASLLLIRAGLVGRRYRKAIADLEAEVHHLRNLPLASGDLSELQDSPDIAPAKRAGASQSGSPTPTAPSSSLPYSIKGS